MSARPTDAQPDTKPDKAPTPTPSPSPKPEPLKARKGRPSPIDVALKRAADRAHRKTTSEV